MTLTTFHAEHVGSLKRPEAVQTARQDYKDDKITKDELKKIEDVEIEKLVQRQAEIGLKIVTDGEARRYSYYHDFYGACEGVDLVESTPLVFNNNTKTEPLNFEVTGKIALGNHPIIEEFKLTNSYAKKYGVDAKAVVPSPNLFLYRDVSEKERELYPTEEDLFEDLVVVYQQLIKDLYDAGCRYLQFDDTAWNFFFNPNPGLLEFRGLERERALKLLHETTNEVLSVKPDDMKIGMHICRGNYKSEHLTEGSYAPVADTVFGQLKYDALFLEFDDERSGDLDVLKHVTDPNLLIVLGFITSKKPELEDVDDIKARIKEASEYLPLDQLALSPQCGFSSTEEGNNITEEEQWAKLQHIVDIADDVWGKTTVK